MGVHAAKLLISLRAPVHKNTAGNLFLDFRPASCSAFCFYSSMNEIRITSRYKNGSNGARTHDLSRVRRTLIPAELCFHVFYYSTTKQKCNRFISENPFPFLSAVPPAAFFPEPAELRLPPAYRGYSSLNRSPFQFHIPHLLLHNMF